MSDDHLPAPLPAPITPAQQSHVLNIVRRAARAEILTRFRNLSASDIADKDGAGDLVTAADEAAERMMTRALALAFPSALIVGEEAAAKDPSLLNRIADAPLAFIIDPVDGTWNFANGLAVFGVILSVTQYGKPAFGLIYDPMADDWAMATAEGPATLQKASGATRPLKCAMGGALEDLTGFIPLHFFEKRLQAQVAATMPGFRRTPNLRCSAHEYRMMAMGQADFLLTPSLNPWDHAAGALIVARAGGHVEMLDGGDYTAARHTGFLLCAPDRTTWNRLRKVFSFLVD